MAQKIRLNERQLRNIIEKSVRNMLSENFGQDIGGHHYTYEILDNAQQAQKWERPTAPGAWCITYGRHFDFYTSRYKGHFVVLIQDGWQQIQRPQDPTQEEGWTPEKPHDAYGNSLIVVMQSNTSPEIILACSRWNHGRNNNERCEGDHAYTQQELEQITGLNFNEIYNDWKQNHAKQVRRARMNEAKLDKIIRQSIKKVLKEGTGKK